MIDDIAFWTNYAYVKVLFIFRRKNFVLSKEFLGILNDNFSQITSYHKRL